jgi:hypothetical protein
MDASLRVRLGSGDEFEESPFDPCIVDVDRLPATVRVQPIRKTHSIPLGEEGCIKRVSSLLLLYSHEL